ncbi:MAG: outer membrane protein assembly factor BamD [Rhodocyclaceae bacterium]|nr:outer membrane protein assembly factor BamD [Rhodocyclaceae bacterium]
MRILTVLAVFLAMLLGGCGLLPDQIDETSNWSADKLYSEAKDALTDGGYDKAVKYLEKLESRFPYGRYAQQAQMEIAYAYYKQGEPISAIAACDRFIKLHPNHPNVDYMYYLKGLVNFNDDMGFLGRFSDQDQTERDPKAASESFDAFKVLVVKFPESRYTPDAILRMKYLVNALAAHEVHVARYYLKRGAYLAAANRAQFAIQTYPDAPAQEEALYLLVKSYEALGMKDLKADAERVLTKTYPKSEFLAGRESVNKKAWWQPW